MNLLILGGTRYFGIHLVNELLKNYHTVTIATRGLSKDNFGDRVSRISFDRTNTESVREALHGKSFDVVYDNIAYCSNDIKNILDVLECQKYILTSSLSAYESVHWNITEEEFLPLEKELKWCKREDYPYGEGKCQAECALQQAYSKVNAIAVRFPYVIGMDDYTKRLYFYIEHVMKKIPMNINNLDSQMSFISSKEAGRFLAFLADSKNQGAVNACADGTISLREILTYVEGKTGQKAVLTPDGEDAPYNGARDYCMNTDKAKQWGYAFSNIKGWIYELVEDSIVSIDGTL